MKSNLFSKIWDAFNLLLYKHTILLLFQIFSIFLLWILIYWGHMSHELMRATILQEVETRSIVLRELGTLYTNDVVKRVIPFDVKVTQNYKDTEGAIPSPSKFILELSKESKKQGSKSELRVFNKNPRDDFENIALSHLKKNPNEVYFKFERYKNREVLRYATGITSSNNELETVLEEIVPVDVSLNLIIKMRQITFILFLIVGLLGTIVIAAVINKLKHSKVELEQTVEERTKDLARSNQELEQFAYVASHDLQEPLRMIASFNQLLAEEYKDKLDAEANSYINFAVDGAKRMQNLISDLLEYSRVGRLDQGIKPIDCNEIFNHAITNLRGAIQESSATVVKEDPLPTINGNELRITQLFQNLIGNAIKYRGEVPPKIHIKAETQGDNWLFSIKDNGIGIDPKHAERIFQIFQRLHARDKYSGTGIGLALCKKIVENHQGKIWVESEEGKGATFYFSIPKSLQ